MECVPSPPFITVGAFSRAAKRMTLQHQHFMTLWQYRSDYGVSEYVGQNSAQIICPHMGFVRERCHKSLAAPQMNHTTRGNSPLLLRAGKI